MLTAAEIAALEQFDARISGLDAQIERARTRKPGSSRSPRSWTPLVPPWSPGRACRWRPASGVGMGVLGRAPPAAARQSRRWEGALGRRCQRGHRTPRRSSFNGAATANAAAAIVRWIRDRDGGTDGPARGAGCHVLLITTPSSEHDSTELAAAIVKVYNELGLRSALVDTNLPECNPLERGVPLPQLFTSLRQRYDHVVVNAPGYLGSHRPALYSTEADSAIVVVETGTTTKRELDDVARDAVATGRSPHGAGGRGSVALTMRTSGRSVWTFDVAGRDVGPLLTCALVVAVGLACALVPPRSLLLAIGVGVVAAVVSTWPLAGLVSILVFFSTILEVDVLPLVTIGVGSVNPIDIVLVGYLLVILYRAIRPQPGRPPTTWGLLDLGVVWFIALLVLSTVAGLQRGTTELDAATNELRVFGYYLTAVVVAHLVVSRADRDRLVDAVLALAVGVALAMIVQLFVGDGLVIVNGRVEEYIAQSGEATTRIIPSGRYLILVGWWLFTALIGLVDRRPPRWYAAGWAITGTAVLVTFNRSFWVASAFVAVVIVTAAAPAQRRVLGRMVVRAGLAAAVVIALVMVSPPNPAQTAIRSVVERGATLVDGSTYDAELDADGRGVSSLEFRRIETAYAAERVGGTVVLGLGAGAAYRPFDDRLDSAEFVNGERYIHNGHVFVILKAGLLGYLALLVAYLATAVGGWRIWQRAGDPAERAIGLVVTVTVPAILATSIVDPAIADVAWAPVFGVLAGWTAVVVRQSSGPAAVGPASLRLVDAPIGSRR